MGVFAGRNNIPVLYLYYTAFYENIAFSFHHRDCVSFFL